MTREAPAPLFAPPTAAACLYAGEVMHARMKPKAHRFTYEVFCLLIDLDRLPDAAAQSVFFSVNRFNLLSFKPADHGDGAGALRPYVDRLLAEAGVDARGGRALLLCYPRMLGFVFNPIAVYYIYDRAGALVALIYEVRNTFGEMHTYVAPVEAGQLSQAGVRQERSKLFYVSPFMDMPMRYRFRMLPPGERVNVRILENDADGPILAAMFTGCQRPLTSWEVVKSCVRLPLMTLKVVAGIHWEAMKLWFKGIEFYTRPPPPAPVSHRDADARTPVAPAPLPTFRNEPTA
jgi:hypothetical protein